MVRRAATCRRGTLRGGIRREISMIDHIGFPVSDYPRSKAFYERRWRRSATR
jgi:hypothetical protein